MKKQPMELEKIFANYISDRRFMHAEYILKHTYSKLSKKINYLIFFPLAKYPNRHFTKEDVLLVNRQIKRYSTSVTGRFKLKTQGNSTTPQLPWLP